MLFCHLKRATIVLFITLLSVGFATADDWIIKSSNSSVAVTADKLVTAVEGAGAKVFARVDHAGGAQSIGDPIDPMVMLMFGNPRLGTPIIKSEPRAGIDLPIRVLIWEADGQTRIGYLDPAALKRRYDVAGADKSFEMMSEALKKLTDAASQ